MSEPLAENSPGMSELASMMTSAPKATPVVEAKPADTTPAQTPAKPVEAPAKLVEAKPEPKPAEAGKEPVKAVDDPLKVKPAPVPDEDEREKNPIELRKRLKSLKTELSTYRETAAQETARLKAELDTLGKRKFLTPEQEATQTAKETRLAELERKLFGQDYRQSPEFKKNFQDKMNSLWDEATQEVVGIPITYQVEEDGYMVEKTRDANAQDLKAVLDASPTERFKLATKLFGDARELVLGHVREMASVRSAAQKAIDDKQKNYETEIQTQTAAEQKASQDYEGFLASHLDQITKSSPDIYGDDPANPEAMESLKKGKSFVEDSFKNLGTFDLNTRAARVANIRVMASAAPRLLTERNQARTRIQELETELKKFRSSDPGSGGEGGEEKAIETPAKEEFATTADMANAFKSK